MKKLIFMLCFISFGAFADTKIQTLVNQYAEKYSNADTKKQGEGISGIQLTVLQNGRMQTYVAGTVGHNIKTPVSPENLFAWGSITKEFTTAIILKLQEQGKLNLNQTLKYWFPENFISTKNEKSPWPKEWANVKIFQLLDMTSGIPNAKTVNEKFWNMKTLFETNWQPNQIVEIAAEYARSEHCKRQCFIAGTHWSYSNTNYIIASLIAEKAKHEAFENQMRDLLKNADITAYYMPDKRPGKYLTQMVHGYDYDSSASGIPNGFDTSNTLQWSTSPAAGTLIGDTQNMAQAVSKLLSGKILSKTATEILNNNYYINVKNGTLVSDITQCTTKNTAGNGCYGLGVAVIYNKTLGPIWRYEGRNRGFRSVYNWSPKKNVIVSASVNSTAGHNDNITKFAADVLNVAMKN
ncbi:MAG: serine hydrolase [Gammaproteobacteria bacterium]|nr:serine hydrolase [Gammaproteobacteria bacterium]